jgi:hypothetical protein
MGFWLVVGFAVVRSLGYFVFLSGGVIRIYVRINEKLSMERFNLYLATKPVLQEERRYDDHNTIVHYSWEEHSRANGELGVKRVVQFQTGRNLASPPRPSPRPLTILTLAYRVWLQCSQSHC